MNGPGVRCLQMRGGTSKGAFFLADDLPADPAARADLLLRVMGSPDPRQIDGLGGGDPLTSKVAVVSPSTDPDVADVDYLFLQVVPDRPVVTDAQTCGNILAGVGPFAIERGLVSVTGETTQVRIRMMNPTVRIAEATIRTPDGAVTYDGDTVMPGTPFPAAPVELAFLGDATPVFPTGQLVDDVEGTEVTCVNAGMPVVVVRAGDLGLTGQEEPATLEADAALRERVEAIRLAAGPKMGRGDVTETTVPKICLVSPPAGDATLATRTFIPHRVHAAIGVLGAVSVAAVVLTPGSVTDGLAGPAPDGRVLIEHPSGTFPVGIELDGTGPATGVRRSILTRTARKLADGLVWPRSDPPADTQADRPGETS